MQHWHFQIDHRRRNLLGVRCRHVLCDDLGTLHFVRRRKLPGSHGAVRVHVVRGWHVLGFKRHILLRVPCRHLLGCWPECLHEVQCWHLQGLTGRHHMLDLRRRPVLQCWSDYLRNLRFEHVLHRRGRRLLSLRNLHGGQSRRRVFLHGDCLPCRPVQGGDVLSGLWRWSIHFRGERSCLHAVCCWLLPDRHRRVFLR